MTPPILKKVRLTNYFRTNINEGSRIVSNEPPFAADASPRSCFAIRPINIVSTNPEWFLYHIEIAKLVATLITTFICALFFLRGDSIYASPHKHYRLHSYTQHHPDWPWDTCE